MTTITVRLLEGMLSMTQRRQLASRLTDVVVQLQGEALRPLVYCTVEEVRHCAWSVGGEPVIGDVLQAIRRGPLQQQCVPSGAATRRATGRTRA